MASKWRSSTTFILCAITMALFTDVFLYGFIVPILPSMLEDRIGFDPSMTQNITFALLAESAFVGVVASPIIGQLASRTPHKKGLLLYSLGAALVSSVALAMSRSGFLLFTSRFVQALASNSIFVLGLATIADNVDASRMGQAMGLVAIAVSVGTSGGTMIAGMLFELVGYWPTWCVPFALIAIDAVMRLLMVEKKDLSKDAMRESSKKHVRDPARAERTQHDERSPLLPEVNNNDDDGVCTPGSTTSCSTATTVNNRSSYFSTASSASSLIDDGLPSVEEKSGLSYYAFVFQQRRFIAGVTCYICYSMIIASFDTTLPLHVREVFNWGSLPSGLMFLALQGPGILLGPVAGWVKDRVGTRTPTAFAFAVTTPAIWLMGIPGDPHTAWLEDPKAGQILYIVCMIIIGFVVPLLNSVGTLELTLAIKEYEGKYPGIFGPNGGTSRAMSIANMSWTFGIFIGPIISGIITDKIGYFEMNTVLAIICLASAVNAYLNLGPRKDPEIET